MDTRWTQIATRVVAAAVLLGSVGCYRATFYRDPTVELGEEHDEWTDFFVFGLVGSEHFDVERFCPSGQVAQVKTGGNFGTGLVSAVTIGIYTPRKVYVTCTAGSESGSESGAEPGDATDEPASDESASSQRQLEIDLSGAGAPVRARLRYAASAVDLQIAPAGPTSWRLSPGS